MSRKPIIEFKQFSFQYNSQSEPTLKDINVTIYEGEKVLVVGPSGSGKSTFAHCINGLIPNSYKGEITGSVIINGNKLEDASLMDLSFEVGTVLQDTDSQFIGLTVAEDVAFALENDEIPQQEMKNRVRRFAELVGLTNHLQHRPQDLSGGEKQRVSMAGVLINEVPLMLFDEPLANLDPATGQKTIEWIDELHETTQTTIVIIEHRLEDVLHRDVDRILVFDEGRVLYDGEPNALLQTDLLSEIGIREPLYVSAMKYAGVDLPQADALASVHKVAAPNLKAAMEEWQASMAYSKAVIDAESLLQIEKLSYRYGRRAPWVLKDVSAAFKKGEMVSIVGQNGAGKSTLSKVICGFVRTNDGKISWKGTDFSAYSIKERADKIGYVLQNPNEMISKTLLYDEVALGLVLRGFSAEIINERIEQILEICGLAPFRDWPISALSYGQKKRVTIAAILVLEPEMIILDEPTAGQDFKHYTEIMQLLETLCEHGVTIVMITHDMHLMLEYSTRVLVFSEGKIIADTKPVDVLTKAALTTEASLKETSLFTFAERLGMKKPYAFTEQFIAYDREVRKK
ncbi:ABC transporter ATP-binding protein [Desemzia sp. RIT804]|uniref:ABC transporter ATP-binding protein n=1 Tax=Desemzia sp. RIT 804 TaxID=2810209 RepID=UPI0019505A41|nr:ABC transporter ATP-binding protein [Desemzia sp. RIT 804]MBM6615237.1 ABC transporter ATP-binding protein [Desemzia sp. RIT 804]